MLCKPPTLEELKNALWSIPQDSSSLGLDGFSASFFMHSWDIIKAVLAAMAEDFFEGKSLTTFFGATNRVLIPKVEVLDYFTKFRPISLYSMAYKILTKIMVMWLAPLLGRLISPEQSAFIWERSIFDNIAIVQELVHGLN